MTLKRWALGLCVLIFSISIGVVWAEEAPEFDIKGSATLEFKYGTGDPWRLWQRNYPIRSLDMAQYMDVSISGDVAPGWRLTGGFKKNQYEDIQFSTIELSGNGIIGRYGGMTLSSDNRYVLQGRRLNGLSIENTTGPLRVKGVFAQIKSIPVEKIFYGRNSSDTIIFEKGSPYSPIYAGEHLKSTIDGLFYYPLIPGIIDPEYVIVSLVYKDGVEDHFADHDLGYLVGHGGALELGKERSVVKGRYRVVSDASNNYLVIKSDEYALIRDDIKDLIREYNLDNGLSGDARKKYPFEADSPEEKAFVDGLCASFLDIRAGYEGDLDSFLSTEFDSHNRQRFYYVGNDNVEPGSLKIHIGSGDTLVSVKDIPGLTYSVNYKEGFVDFSFPTDFFDEYDSIKITYDYRVAEGAFPLGISVVPGSERVYVDDKLLRRNVDYAINYQFGLLFLYRDVEPTDVIRIQYEVAQKEDTLPWDGGRYLLGASATYQASPALSLGLDMYRIAGSLRSDEDEESIPNEYMVMGISSTYDKDGLNARADIAYSREINPSDGFIPEGSNMNDNERVSEGKAIGLEVSKSMEKANIFLKYEDIDPEYMPIGWYSRKALERFSLGGGYNLTPDMTLSYTRTFQKENPMVGTTVSADSGTKEEKDEITLALLPRNINLIVSQEKVDKLGKGKSTDLVNKKVAVETKQRYKDADISLRLEGVDSQDFLDESLSYKAYNLFGSYRGQIAPGVSLRLSRLQPLISSGRSREETALSLNWSKYLDETYMNAGYAYDYTNRSVGDEYGSFSSSKVSGRLSTTLGDIRVSGSTQVVFTDEVPFNSQEERTGRKVSLSGSLGVKDFVVDGNTSWDRFQYPLLDKVTNKETFGLSCRYNGWEGMIPRISITDSHTFTESSFVEVVPSHRRVGKFTLTRKISSVVSAEEALEIETRSDSKNHLTTRSIREKRDWRLAPQSNASISLEGITRDGTKESKDVKERELALKVTGAGPVSKDARLTLDCGYIFGNNQAIEKGDYQVLTIGSKLTFFF